MADPTTSLDRKPGSIVEGAIRDVKEAAAVLDPGDRAAVGAVFDQSGVRAGVAVDIKGVEAFAEVEKRKGQPGVGWAVGGRKRWPKK